MTQRPETDPPPPRGAKGQHLAEHLSREILSGRYAAGQRLIEGDLTRDLGVSRGLLREAFRLLAAEGLIEIVPNRGAMVRRLSHREAVELLEIRTELEAFAARRAAARMADPCVRQTFMRATRPIWDDTPRSGFDIYIAENRAFHRALLDSAGNAQLVQMHERMQLALLLAQVRFAIGEAAIRTSMSEHRAIAEAVTEGDAALAEARLRAHLGGAADMMRAMPADAFRPEPATVQAPQIVT